MALAAIIGKYRLHERPDYPQDRTITPAHSAAPRKMNGKDLLPIEPVNEKTPSFHWMMGCGDYTRELGYMLRRVGIQWDNLDKYPKY